MSRPPPDALNALAPVVAVLDQLRVPYHIGGSLASAAYGVPRASADVDIVAELGLDQVDPFVEELHADYYVSRDAMREAIRQRRSFNLVHMNTMMKVDVFVPELLPFAEQEQRRSRPQSFDVGGNIPSFMVKSPEDLVLRKLSWYRAGGETSERQWSDVIGVLKVQAERIDRGYLNRWAAELGVADLLERAFGEASNA